MSKSFFLTMQKKSQKVEKSSKNLKIKLLKNPKIQEHFLRKFKMSKNKFKKLD